MPTTPMSFSQLFFSFEGRIPRSVFWLKFYIPVIGINLLAIVLDYVFGTIHGEYGVGMINSIVGLLLIWPCFAGYIKRLHDRGRSAW